MMLSRVDRMPTFVRRTMCLALPFAERFGLIRFAMRNSPVIIPPQFNAERDEATRALRDERVKAAETDATQGCASTEGGAIRPDKGSGDPEVDGAARSAGSLRNLPLMVLVAGKYWQPDDANAAREIADFHQNWVDHLQPELAQLSAHGRLIIVGNSDHGIPEEAPEAIVNAVFDIVLEVRNRQRK